MFEKVGGKQKLLHERRNARGLQEDGCETKRPQRKHFQIDERGLGFFSLARLSNRDGFRAPRLPADRIRAARPKTRVVDKKCAVFLRDLSLL